MLAGMTMYRPMVFSALRAACGELVDDLRQLVVCRVVGRGDDDDVAVDAVDIAADGIADEAVVEGGLADAGEELLLGRERLSRLAIGDEFDADEIAAAADVADGIDATQRIAHHLHQPGAVGVHALDEAVARLTMVCTATPAAQAGGMGGEGVAGEGGAVHGEDRLGDLAVIDGGAERQIAAGQGLSRSP